MWFCIYRLNRPETGACQKTLGSWKATDDIVAYTTSAVGRAKVGLGALNKIGQQQLETLDVQGSKMFQNPADRPL